MIINAHFILMNGEMEGSSQTIHATGTRQCLAYYQTITKHLEFNCFAMAFLMSGMDMNSAAQNACWTCRHALAPQQLTTTRVANENCTLEQECPQEEVLLCHYQMSKKSLESSLRTDANKSETLLKEGRLRANYLEGFVSRVDVANATTTRS